MSARPSASEVQRFIARRRGEPMPPKRSTLEERMDQLIARSALPPPEIDVELLPARRYRSDYAWPERRITLEVDGTIRGAQGGHQSEDGMTSDARKALLLAIDGWLTVRVTATMIRSGEAIDLLERLFGVSRAGAAD